MAEMQSVELAEGPCKQDVAKCKFKAKSAENRLISINSDQMN